MENINNKNDEANLKSDKPKLKRVYLYEQSNFKSMSVENWLLFLTASIEAGKFVDLKNVKHLKHPPYYAMFPCFYSKRNYCALDNYLIVDEEYSFDENYPFEELINGLILSTNLFEYPGDCLEKI